MLKKIVLTIAALTALSGISYALTNPDFIENVPGVNFKTSTNVKVMYKNDAATVPQNYAIVSKHSSGDTYYATSNISTSIMKKKVDSMMGKPMLIGDTTATAIPAGDSIFTTWDAM